LVYLYIQKQDILSIMLYKVYVNICDIRVGSYVTLGTKAAQCYISTCHWDDPCQISLHLFYEFIRIFLTHFPFLGVGPFMTPGTSFAQTWITLSQGCFISNINEFRPLVCERNIFQIPKISPIVAPFWVPKGTNLLICAHFILHSAKMLPTKFSSNQFNVFGERAF